MSIGDTVKAILEIGPAGSIVVTGVIKEISSTSILIQTEGGTGWVEKDSIFEIL